MIDACIVEDYSSCMESVHADSVNANIQFMRGVSWRSFSSLQESVSAESVPSKSQFQVRVLTEPPLRRHFFRPWQANSVKQTQSVKTPLGFFRAGTRPAAATPWHEEASAARPPAPNRLPLGQPAAKWVTEAPAHRAHLPRPLPLPTRPTLFCFVLFHFFFLVVSTCSFMFFSDLVRFGLAWYD